MARKLTPEQLRQIRAEKRWKAFMRYFNKQQARKERTQCQKTCTTGIVRHKRLLAQSIQARAEYANIVNALKSPETAEQGTGHETLPAV